MGASAEMSPLEVHERLQTSLVLTINGQNKNPQPQFQVRGEGEQVNEPCDSSAFLVKTRLSDHDAINRRNGGDVKSI
jgi:hypothetical protein